MQALAGRSNALLAAAHSSCTGMCMKLHWLAEALAHACCPPQTRTSTRYDLDARSRLTMPRSMLNVLSALHTEDRRKGTKCCSARMQCKQVLAKRHRSGDRAGRRCLARTRPACPRPCGEPQLDCISPKHGSHSREDCAEEENAVGSEGAGRERQLEGGGEQASPHAHPAGCLVAHRVQELTPSRPGCLHKIDPYRYKARPA